MGPRRAVSRIAISSVVGLVAYLLAAGHLRPVTAMLLAGDAAISVLLGMSWLLFFGADAATTRSRAADFDPGRTLVYVVVLVASTASLLAGTLLARRAGELEPAQRGFGAALCLVTVAISWATTHTAFAFRYAHLYYREDAEGVGGILFPGDAAPTYVEFAYFAYTVGMCFQVADTDVTSRQIRLAVLLHAVISFTYNSLILAFVLNLVFGVANSP